MWAFMVERISYSSINSFCERPRSSLHRTICVASIGTHASQARLPWYSRVFAECLVEKTGFTNVASMQFVLGLSIYLFCSVFNRRAEMTRLPQRSSSAPHPWVKVACGNVRRSITKVAPNLLFTLNKRFNAKSKVSMSSPKLFGWLVQIVQNWRVIPAGYKAVENPFNNG